jgi:hypothetical protein
MLFRIESDEHANIKQNFGLALPDLFRVSVLWRRRVLCGELRQLSDVASDRGERVPCVSPSGYPTGDWLHGNSDAHHHHINNSSPVVQASSYPTVVNRSGGRASTYYLGFHFHHSIAHSNATERGWFVTAAYQPAHIHQLVVTQSAANYECAHFRVAHVFIDEGKFPTQRRSITLR